MAQHCAAHRLAIATACGLAAFPAPAPTETLLSVYTGTSRTRHADLQLRQPGAGTDLTARDVHWAAHPLRPAPYYGLRLARFAAPPPGWGAALDFTHYKVYAETDRPVAVAGGWRGAQVSEVAPLNRYVQRFEVSHGVNVLSVNGIYRWDAGGRAAGRLQPYAGLGVAYYVLHAESVVGNVPHESGYRGSGLGVQALAGVQYRMTERTGLFAEVKFDRGHAKASIADGRAETPLRTFHVTAGVQVAFR